MKKMKKLVGILLTLAMVVAMSITTFAANITINGGAVGSKYAAYKLLNATDGGDGKYAYTLNSKYASILETATGKNTEKEIVAYISGLNLPTSQETTRMFADKIYAAIKTAKKDADYVLETSNTIEASTGYYLIVETSINTEGENKSYSLAMLGTVGNEGLNANVKKSVPSLEKKVKEKNDSKNTETDWQDGADYDLNDAVPFKLKGTVPSDYASYQTYYYAFHDKMSNGLTFNNSVKVSVDGTEITSGYSVVTEGLTDGCTFEVRFNNLKDIEAVKAGSTIEVEYTATLNNLAVIGSAGNPNEARLEYSNNPYGGGTGITPWDKVIVFTYELVANKVDGSNNPLEGAGFTLYKYDMATSNYVVVKEFANDEAGKEGKQTTFTFSRLDAGPYKLEESKVPDGYNKAEDLIFKVVAKYETNADNPKFGELKITDLNDKEITDKFTLNQTKDQATTNVVNLSGTELPSTGGMGTTILYVIGAILVIGAGILLVTKKRMNANK